MVVKMEKTSETSSSDQPKSDGRMKLRYAPPSLEVYGSLADLTQGMGGSDCDGNNTNTQNNPGGGPCDPNGTIIP